MRFIKSNMETKINIAGILKDKPEGTRLYSPLFGDVYLLGVEAGIIRVKHYRENETLATFYTFYRNGKYFSYPESEPLLFPSKEMRDWSKFAWKKGDVLVSNDSTTKIIFNGWKDDTYTLFWGAYAVITHNDGKVEFGNDSLIFETCNYKGIEVEDDEQFYINYIERKLGGKLNLETLEIEKAHPEFKDGNILYITDRIVSCNFIMIYKNQEGDRIYHYATLPEDNLVIMTKRGFLSDNGGLSKRYATEEEKQQLFEALAKKGKAWDAEKKAIVDLKPRWTPKPFDRVITKVDDDAIWTANIFSHIDQYGEYVTIGCESGYSYCLPYNEETAKLIGTTKDVED